MKDKPDQAKQPHVTQTDGKNKKRAKTYDAAASARDALLAITQQPAFAQRLELVLQDKTICAEEISNSKLWKQRFKRYLPVVIDVETGGVDCTQDALLEVAVVMLNYDAQQQLVPQFTESVHIQPFAGGRLTAEAMAINGIDPDHPFRFAMPEAEALEHIFTAIYQGVKNSGCQRAVLVGHNAHFDLNFLQAAIARCKVDSPLHRFTCYDTATLAGVYYGHSVLAKALVAAGIGFDPKQAHSAVYDTEQTAKLFCKIVNAIHVAAHS